MYKYALLLFISNSKSLTVSVVTGLNFVKVVSYILPP